MNDFITVKAKIKVLTTEEGGKRKAGIASGYRPNHVFELPQNNQFITYAGDISFDGIESIYPGDKENVIVRFIKNQDIDKYIFKGNKWWIYEVPNLIAEAEILEIFNN